MRDPKRIPRILAKLQAAWLSNPDQRLGQLLVNVNRDVDTDPSMLFHVEDDVWEQKIQAYFTGKKT